MTTDYGDHSEYNGGGVQPNTLYPKDLQDLTIAERLRLQSITGQDEDPKALPDPAFWNGAQVPDAEEIRRLQRQEAQRERVRQRAETDRYRRRK